MSDRDTRIVEMQFDNRKFERNIAKSQKSLEDFKKELDFDETSRGLTKFSSGLNKLSFDNLIGNVQKLTDKFTGLGDASEFVLSRLRHNIESTALKFEQFVKSFTIQQFTIGQGKYDALNKAVQTIVAAGKYTEDEAYKVFERVMQYTDQTSASFESMVSAISNFTSVGQGLGDSERALEGIFNMTAKAGQSVSQASVAMEVFSKAMGMGYLDSQKWQSLITTAKIGTTDFRQSLIEAAVSVGDLVEKNGKYYTNTAKGLKRVEVTAENLETTLHTKWASKQTMMALFDKYYFAKLTGATEEELESFAGVAYKSAQRALTFADAMGAIKEAVSSGWMESFRIILGKVSEAMEFFTNLCDKVIDSLSGISEARNMVLRAWSETGGRNSLISIVLGDYGKEVETGAYGLLDLFDSVGNMISKGFWDMVKIFARSGERGLWDQAGYKEAWLGVHLAHLTEQIQNFFGSVKAFFNEEIVVNGQVTTRLEMIHKIIDGIVAILAIGWQILVGVVHFVVGLRQKLQPSIDAVVAVFAKLGEALFGAAEDAHDSKGIINFFDQLLVSVTPLTDSINYLVTTIASLLIQFIEWGKESGFFKTVLDLIAKAFNLIAKVVSAVGGPLITFFADFFTIIQDLFTNGFTKESLKAAGKKLGEAFKHMLEGLVESIPDSLSGLRDAIKDLLGLWGDDVDRSGSIFTKIRKTLGSGFNGVFSFIKGLFEGFKDLNLHDIFSLNGIFGIAYKALNEVAGWFKGVNLYGVIMAFLGVAVLWKLFRLIATAKKAVSGVKDFFDNLSDNLRYGFHTRSERFGEYMLNIAKGLAIITACVMVLGTLDLGLLVQGVVALTAILGIVWVFQKVLKKSFENNNLKDTVSYTAALFGIGFFITACAAAVAIIAIALIPISAMGWQALSRAMTALIMILMSLGLFVYLMIKAMKELAGQNRKGKTDTKELLKIAGMMFIMAGAMAVLAAGIGLLAIALVPLTLTGWEGLARAMSALVVMLAAIGGFMLLMFKILRKWSKGNTGELGKFGMIMLEVAGGIALLAVGIGLLAIALIPLAVMSWSGWARAMAGLGVILLEIAGFVKIIQIIGKDDKKVTAQIKGLAGLAAGIGLLVFSLTPLALVSWEGFAKMVAGLTVVLLEIIGMVWIVKKMGQGQQLSVKIFGLASLVAAIAALVFALIPLAAMDLPHLIQAVVALGVIMLELLGFIKLTMKMIDGMKNPSIKIAGVIGMVISIIGVAWAVSILGGMDNDRLAAGIAAIGVIMLFLLGFLKLVAGTEVKAKTAVMALALMLGVVVAAIAISFALNEVKNIKWEVIAAFMAGLAILIIAVAGAIKILENTPLVGGLKAIIILAAAVAAIVLVLSLVLPMLVESLGTSFMNLSARLKLMSEMFAGFAGTMSSINDDQLDRAEVVITRLLSIIGLLGGFDRRITQSVNEFYNAMFILSGSFDIFNRTSRQIGDPDKNNAFLLIEKLKTLKQDLGDFDFSNILQGLFDIALGLSIFDYAGKDISSPEDSATLGIITTLADSIDKLKALETINTSYIAGQLYALGGALSIYALGAKELTGLKPEETPDVGKAVGFLNQVVQSLTDENGEFTIPSMPSTESLDYFGLQLSSLALALSSFVQSSEGWSDKTDKAVSLLGFLSGDLQTNLTDDAVKTVNIFGKNSITQSLIRQFALDIIALGFGLSMFIDYCKDLDAGKLNTATSTIGYFSTLRTELINNDVSGVVGYVTSTFASSVMRSFATDIAMLGYAMYQFAEYSNFDESRQKSVDLAVGSIERLGALYDALPRVGGVWQWIVGHKSTLGEFGADLSLLGVGVKEFIASTDADDSTYAKVGYAVKALTALANIYPILPYVGGLNAFFAGDQSLENFGRDLGYLGSGVKGFFDSVNKYGGGIDLYSAGRVIELLSQIKGIYTEMARVAGTLGGTYHPNADKNFIDVATYLSYAISSLNNSNIWSELAELIYTINDVIIEVEKEYGYLDFEGVYDYLLVADELFALFEKYFNKYGVTLGGVNANGITDSAPKVAEAAQEVVEATKEVDAAFEELEDTSKSGSEENDFRRFNDFLNNPGGSSRTNYDAAETYSEQATQAAEDMAKMAAEADAVRNEVSDNMTDAEQDLVSKSGTTQKELDTLFEEESKLATDVSDQLEGAIVGYGTELETVNQGLSDSLDTAETGITGLDSKLDDLETKLNGVSDVMESDDPFGQITEFMQQLSEDNPLQDIPDSIDFDDIMEVVDLDDYVTDLDEDTLAGAARVIGTISAMLADNIDPNPTITPVLDMTNLEAGITQMNSMLASNGIVAGTGRASWYIQQHTPAKSSEKAAITNQNGTDLSGLYGRFAQMQASIEGVGNKIANMKLVLDTGVVAGGVADKIDSILGRKTFYETRRG